jgi:hypothetical protein
MKNLYLPDSKELTRICEITKLHQIQIVPSIITRMQIMEIDLDSQNDAGLEISQIMEEMGYDLNGFCYDVLGQYNEELAFLIGKLKFKNVLDDCPECGCEVEEREEAAWDYVWEEKDCTNPSCDYALTNQPDWDLHLDR